MINLTNDSIINVYYIRNESKIKLTQSTKLFFEFLRIPWLCSRGCQIPDRRRRPRRNPDPADVSPSNVSQPERVFESGSRGGCGSLCLLLAAWVQWADHQPNTESVHEPDLECLLRLLWDWSSKTFGFIPDISRCSFIFCTSSPSIFPTTTLLSAIVNFYRIIYNFSQFSFYSDLKFTYSVDLGSICRALE